MRDKLNNLENCSSRNNLKIDWIIEEDCRKTAEVSRARTHSAHHSVLIYHNAHTKNMSIEDVTQALSCSEFTSLEPIFQPIGYP